MSDPTGKLLIVRKHYKRENGKKARKHFFEPGDIETVKEIAQSYAEQKGDDFLIVQVVAEASHPNKAVKK